MFRGKRTAESAAILRVLHFDQGEPGNILQQPARLILYMQFAQGMACVVVGHGGAEGRAHVFRFQGSYQELAELMRFFRDLMRFPGSRVTFRK